MRDFLTGLAIILIVVLTTLLVAPYFVDWNGQRSFLEKQLSRAFGQTVTIGGNIDLKLLPTPYLRLNQTVIGSDDGAVRIGIRHLDLELSVAPLLHGEIDIVEGRLDEPTIRVTLQTDRNLPVLPDTPALRANIRIERVQVVNGTLAIADPQSGHTFLAEHLDFTTEASSLAGPYKGSGTQGTSEARTKFRFSTSAPGKGKTRARLVVDETTRHPGLELDGDIALSRIANERVHQSFDGTFAASGQIAGADKPIAWRLTAPLKADPQSASFTDGQLRIGGEDNALTLQASGGAVFGDASAVHLKLTAQQLDIDRLAGAPVDQTRPPTPKLPAVSALKQLFAAVTPPLTTLVDVDVETATWGGETLNGLVAHAVLGGPAPRPIRVSGDGPGGLHVDISGDLAETGRFAGHAKMAADNLPASLRWLAAVTTAALPTDLPVRTMNLDSRFTTTADALDLSDTSVALDRSTFKGSAHVATGERTNVSANLTTAALDLDALPNLTAIENRTIPLDITLVLDARTLKIAHAGEGRLDAGHVHLDAAVDRSRLAVKDFSAENLGGGSLKASGSADENAASLSMAVDAPRLEQAAALARQMFPGSVADALANRTAVFAPAKLKIDAALVATARHPKFMPTRLDVAGTLAETRLDIHLAPDSGNDNVTLTAKAEAAHGRTLISQLGLSVVPIDSVGESRISLVARGPRGRPLNASVEATFGGSKLTAVGSFDVLAGGGQGGSGTVTLKSDDAAPLLQTLALVPYNMLERMPVDLTGGLAFGDAGLAVSDLNGRFDAVDLRGALRWQTKTSAELPNLTGSLNVDRLNLGSLLSVVLGPRKAPAAGATWSSEPFDPGFSAPVRTAVTVQAKTIDLGLNVTANNASLDIGIAPDVLTLKHTKAEFAGGNITGDLAVRRNGAQAFLEGSIALDNAALDLSSLAAKMEGKLDFAGSGQSPLALVTSMAGSGAMTLENTRVAGVDATSLPAAFAATEDDTLAVDYECIRRALEDAPAGSLDVGTRHFTVGLAGGSLSATAKDRTPAEVGRIGATLGGSLDLRHPQVEVHVDEVLRALPKGWTGAAPSVTVRQTAILGGQAQRSFDVTAFTNAVAARAIARESARIESYEFDTRERALFNTRLESERRREQDRLKIDADRKAKIEAARLEKLRTERSEKERDNDGAASASGANAPAPPPDRFGAQPPGASVDPSAAGRY